MLNPRATFKDSADYYAGSFTVGQQPTYGSYPTIDDIAGFFQPAPSELVEEYLQRQDQISSVFYLLDECAYRQISVRDRLVVDGVNFRIIGKRDLSGRHRIFRLDLKQDLSAE